MTCHLATQVQKAVCKTYEYCELSWGYKIFNSYQMCEKDLFVYWGLCDQGLIKGPRARVSMIHI